jgi:hypothetical protein
MASEGVNKAGRIRVRAFANLNFANDESKGGQGWRRPRLPPARRSHQKTRANDRKPQRNQQRQTVSRRAGRNKGRGDFTRSVNSIRGGSRREGGREWHAKHRGGSIAKREGAR